jgi:hypothetical protein
MSVGDPWAWEDDPDTLSGTQLVRDPRLHGARRAADILSRRQQLRQSVQAAVSGRMSGTDLAVGVGAGLVSAIPGTPLDEMAAGRVSQLLSLTQNGEADAMREGILGMGFDAQDVARRLQSGDLGNVDQLFSLDGEDMVGAAAARWMTDKWAAKRGWESGDRPYHEFKALTYGVNALATAPFNPNPIMLGLAAWHLFSAMAASWQLTQDIRELADLAIEEGRQAIADLDREVALWEPWSAAGARVARAPILIGEDGRGRDARLLGRFGGR